MEISVNNIEIVNFSYLKKLQSVVGDLEIARRVVRNDKSAVHYFLGEFSIPFLNYIGRDIMKLNATLISGVNCFYPGVIGYYYEFIGAKFIEENPSWHKVALYKGIKNKGMKEARLYTYINTVTVRYFIAIKRKEAMNNGKKIDNMTESLSVSTLKEYDGFDEILLSEEQNENSELDNAWNRLPEKDQLILKYLVIEEMDPLDIFDEMILYVRTEIPSESYTRKQRQDAMALMKRRAKAHLRDLIIEIRKK